MADCTSIDPVLSLRLIRISTFMGPALSRSSVHKTTLFIHRGRVLHFAENPFVQLHCGNRVRITSRGTRKRRAVAESPGREVSCMTSDHSPVIVGCGLPPEAS
ncbi:hypothetical protein CEXT_657611 [Caerostris extrusa]|uniref:Uncharacterized protein n=1 Tax=Caerostris extrusa TaxID=172846 RepID=A0AAV4M455_CAEEX|nr:hypothetical protein CEXT_657611 [Caerostris extrusa]